MENPTELEAEVLIDACLRAQAKENGLVYKQGVLERLPDGYGFIRSAEHSYLPGPEDVYVSPTQIRRFNLLTGDTLAGSIRPPKQGEKYFALVQIDSINYDTPNKALERALFKSLTPYHPERQIKVEIPGDDLIGRVIDLLSPLGFGQRALIVSPPRAGKTILLQAIAQALAHNHPDVKLIVLLLDERPEEVTDMRRSVRGEVVYSTFDEPASRHTAVGEIVLEKARRMVESGHDVVILLDSLTRPGPRPQHGHPVVGPCADRWRRRQRFGETEKVLRLGARSRGGGLVDHRRDRADRDRQPHG